MKKLIIIFITSFIIFSLVFSNKEIKEFGDVYKANSMYIQNNLTWATNIYNSVNEKWLNDSNKNILEYLKWNIKYREWYYYEALNILSKIETKWNDKLQFYKNNILWNIKYRLWEWWNDFDKLKYWKESLNNYMSAINQIINENKKNTFYNYNLVKNKLDVLKKKLEETQKKKDEEKKKEQEKQNNSWTWTQNSNQTQSNSWSKESTNNIGNQQWKNWWNFNWVWNQNSIWSWSEKLTPDEKKELNDYSNSLKEFQKNNNQYLQRWNQNKSNTKQDIFDKMMNEFQSDPFFKDVIPQENVDKDW